MTKVRGMGLPQQQCKECGLIDDTEVWPTKTKRKADGTMGRQLSALCHNCEKARTAKYKKSPEAKARHAQRQREKYRAAREQDGPIIDLESVEAEVERIAPAPDPTISPDVAKRRQEILALLREGMLSNA